MRYPWIHHCIFDSVLATGACEFPDFLAMLPKVERSGDTEEELEEAFR